MDDDDNDDGNDDGDDEDYIWSPIQFIKWLL